MLVCFALKSVQEQYGIKIHVGNASFTAAEITFKCKCNTLDESGETNTREAETWPHYAAQVGLGHLKVGDSVTLNDGKTYTIKGWKSTSRKYPVLLKGRDGRHIKCTPQLLKMHNSLLGNDEKKNIAAFEKTEADMTKARLKLAWPKHAGRHGLGHLKCGDKVKIKGETYTIDGWNTKNTKFKVQLSNESGGLCKCRPEQLLKRLKKEEKRKAKGAKKIVDVINTTRNKY
eukprot:g1233.t1